MFFCSPLLPFLSTAVGHLWWVIFLHVRVNSLRSRERDPARVTLLWGHMVEAPELPLPGTVHKNRPHAQVVMEQVAVVDQETHSFLWEEANIRSGVSAHRGQVTEQWLPWKYQMAPSLTTIWCSPQETSSSPDPPFSAWAFRWTARGVTCSVTRYRLFSVCENNHI